MDRILLMTKALITGINGQDGQILEKYLQDLNYEVFGLIRPSSDRVKKSDNYFYADLLDSSRLNEIVKDIQPDHVYNLGGQSNVRLSYEMPYYTMQTNTYGCVNILNAVKNHCPTAKVFQASSSEIYGKNYEGIKNESSKHTPSSPYGLSKSNADYFVKNYREKYGIFACSGILFNHSSPVQSSNYVLGKICKYVGTGNFLYPLELGNLSAIRDFGSASDYVEAMHLMLKADNPEDYIICTGQHYTLRNILEKCFNIIGHCISWEGSGINEKGYINETDYPVVVCKDSFFDPRPQRSIIGSNSKIRKNLNWKPKTNIEDLLKEIIYS